MKRNKTLSIIALILLGASTIGLCASTPLENPILRTDLDGGDNAITNVATIDATEIYGDSIQAIGSTLHSSTITALTVRGETHFYGTPIVIHTNLTIEQPVDMQNTVKIGDNVDMDKNSITNISEINFYDSAQETYHTIKVEEGLDFDGNKLTDEYYNIPMERLTNGVKTIPLQQTLNAATHSITNIGTLIASNLLVRSSVDGSLIDIVPINNSSARTIIRIYDHGGTDWDEIILSDDDASLTIPYSINADGLNIGSATLTCGDITSDGNLIILNSLPTSEPPQVGALWVDGVILKVSDGP